MFKIKCEDCGKEWELDEKSVLSDYYECDECGCEMDSWVFVKNTLDANSKIFNQCYKKYKDMTYTYGKEIKTVSDLLVRLIATTWFIPASVTEIKNDNLSVMHIENILFEEGSNLKHIGEYAFSNDCYLESLDIPDSVECINNGAFYGCYKIKKIILPRAITKYSTIRLNNKGESGTLGVEAFYLCTGVKEFMHSKKLKVKECFICKTKMPMFKKECPKCSCKYIPY